ncbi:MAG: hypothetical protein ABI051_09765 [Vicinamibacterales bacterium]
MPQISTADAANDYRGTPWSLRLGLALVVVVLFFAAILSYGIRTWPMADDEVPSLVEMGLIQVDASAFSVPADQLGRLPKSLPVWYAVQRRLISVLPAGELRYRLPSLFFALATVGLGFVLVSRMRGLWFGLALAVVLAGSQPFLLLSQVDRFYAMPLFLEVVFFSTLWWRRGGTVLMSLAAVTVAVLTFLSHNITLPVLVLAFMAACVALVVNRIPFHVVWRSGLALTAGAVIYLAYVRPLVSGWHSTGNPTPVLVSFSAHAGIATLALALFGGLLSLLRRNDDRSMLWWALMFAGSLCLFQLTSISWNPRYFLFYMPAMWMLAAHAMDFVRRKLGSSLLGAGWYACVGLLFVPGVMSHYQDGSRHDYRQAAAVVLAHARESQPILSDDAETISYYLPEDARRRLLVRTKVTEFPASEFFVVVRSNVWMPLPQIPGRQMDLLAEISHRRLDQFSHVLRVYRVRPAMRTIS